MATESEIKAKLKIPRLTKSQVKGLTSLTLPSDSGTHEEEEVNYIFRDPESPFRKLKCRVVLGQNSEYDVLPKDSSYWQAQADRHLHTMLSEREKTFCMQKLMQAGSMLDFDSWSASKFNLKGDGGETEKQEAGESAACDAEAQPDGA